VVTLLERGGQQLVYLHEHEVALLVTVERGGQQWLYLHRGRLVSGGLMRAGGWPVVAYYGVMARGGHTGEGGQTWIPPYFPTGHPCTSIVTGLARNTVGVYGQKRLIFSLVMCA
jgi:hypothetical protein